MDNSDEDIFLETTISKQLEENSGDDSDGYIADWSVLPECELVVN